MKSKNALVSFIIALFFFSFSINSFAQVDSAKSSPVFENNLSCFFIGGYSIAYSRALSPASKLRVLFDYNGNFSSDEMENVSGISNSSSFTWNQSKTENSSNYFTSTIALNYIHTVYNYKHIELYVGSGLYSSYNLQNYKYDNEDRVGNTNGTRIIVTSSYNTYAAGLHFVFGFEGRLANGISLFAESQYKLGRTWKKNENEYETYTTQPHYDKSYYTQDGNGWEFLVVAARLGIGFYF
ncbi:MAG: hypothetical protein KJ799_16785 [Bacteroidetes bacterium]|nr:hypothetical protein [Bacteroidota bacterium]MBU1677937.1 hypothetical protein [Bacteroidota bacterium]MBU2508355.1 hypothetical protein [Bacteroidota bacterium]